MLLIDLTHTSHTPARTGIQRVARALHQNLTGRALPVTRDPFLGAWRPLEAWELANLARSRGGHKRKAEWPRLAKWRGRLRRALGRTPRHAVQGEFDGLIAPELFGPRVARDYPKLFPHVRGPRVALFLDAIPLRFPELTPPGTVARFPAYLQELLMFDGIAAISEESRDSLVSYWRWLGAANPPPVVALPLGVDEVAYQPARDTTASKPKPIVLSVGTLEGRKNHLALLDACEALWARGVVFELRIIGHVNAETGGAALARLRTLQSSGRPLRFDGPATDETIREAYAECAFTIYPSIAEGFGLPVIESLAHGTPCVCSACGALGEISRHGGCVPLESLDPSAIGAAIEDLLARPAELAQLSVAARQRRFKSWADYTRELTT
ncbi:MAG TPA: glycosyltransferase family 1 protein, partial [Opitutus sp.]|nr:glycosyltransferase family 1 protein [Opitutus sp.]